MEMGGEGCHDPDDDVLSLKQVLPQKAE